MSAFQFSIKTNENRKAGEISPPENTMTMKLNFKTLDHKSFSLTVNETEDLVEDLISRIEDIFGRENLYKLIFSGKLLKEEDPLTKYKLKSKIPIIVMITQSPKNIMDNSKEDKNGVSGGKEMTFLSCLNIEVNFYFIRKHRWQKKVS